MSVQHVLPREERTPLVPGQTWGLGLLSGLCRAGVCLQLSASAT